MTLFARMNRLTPDNRHPLQGRVPLEAPAERLAYVADRQKCPPVLDHRRAVRGLVGAVGPPPRHAHHEAYARRHPSDHHCLPLKIQLVPGRPLREAQVLPR